MKKVFLPIMMLAGGAVWAAEPGTNTASKMPEVVVTATRSEAEPFTVPYITEVLTVERLQEEQMARTVPEALKETPAVMVQKTGHGQGSPFIRGFTGFRTLFLIDGIRLNNSTFREGPNQYWNTVDPFSVGRLELVKGPSSVLYGSDAIGGTVNALTLAGPETLTGRAYYRFASAEDSHTARAEGGGGAGPVRLWAGVSVKSYGDLNDMPKTGYEEWNADLKAEYRLDEERRLVAAFQHVDQDDAWRTHRTIYARSFQGSTIGTDQAVIFDQNRNLAYLQYQSEPLRLGVSYQYQGETQDRVRSNWRRELSEVDVHTLGLQAQMTTPTRWGVWTYGAEYYRDWVSAGQVNFNSNGTVNAVLSQGPVADNATYDLLGAYVQNQIALPARWELTLGGRYTYARAEAAIVTNVPGGIEEDWHNVVGSARLQWQMDRADHWRLFGGVSQGFRAPNLSDLTRFDIARSGEVEVPAPGLDPERFLAFELGVKTQYENFQAELAWFYTLIDDMIVRQPTGVGNQVSKRNSGEGYVQGIEASARWQFHPQWSLFGWITWMESEVDSYPTSAPVRQREYLSRVMPLSGQLGLRWDAPSKRFWAETFTSMVDRADKLSAGDQADTQRIPPGGTPGYAIATVRGGWRINPHFTVSVACENVFDKTYRVHGSGINEPERNFVVAAEARF